jgi:hypothetical protein
MKRRMRSKMHVIEAIGIAILLICGIIIWFNTTLKSQSSENVIGFRKFQPVNVTPEDTNYIDWEDNFDTSYVDETTGCVVFTTK